VLNQKSHPKIKKPTLSSFRDKSIKNFKQEINPYLTSLVCWFEGGQCCQKSLEAYWPPKSKNEKNSEDSKIHSGIKEAGAFKIQILRSPASQKLKRSRRGVR